ncbi:MAG: phosphoribosylanthranilate isomerase [Planctomycetes bacterium]|nr:phosphoribosylanthranilate isomerase [Planctomycetota bacterium]
MKPPFRVKICGVARPEDARVAVDAGADALGLNYYPGSRRFVSRETAEAIRDAVAGEAQLVGVFVNATISEIAAAVEIAGLDLVQLHGDEPPEFVSELRATGGRLAAIPVIRAFRSGRDLRDGMACYVQTCSSRDAPLTAALIDADAGRHYGGSGKTIDWSAFRRLRDRLADLPLILAGGLTAENVEQAIAVAAPDAVDVASGVESAPGRKDPVLVRQFVATAKRCFKHSS